MSLKTRMLVETAHRVLEAEEPSALKEIAAILARGYHRLLAHQATVSASADTPATPSKPVDSSPPKSVNVLENSGDGNA